MTRVRTVTTMVPAPGRVAAAGSQAPTPQPHLARPARSLDAPPSGALRSSLGTALSASDASSTAGNEGGDRAGPGMGRVAAGDDDGDGANLLVLLTLAAHQPPEE